jgi:hypothetical protein
MQKPKDKDGKVIHVNDKVSFEGVTWLVDRIAGTRVYLSYFGSTNVTEASKVKKIR